MKVRDAIRDVFGRRKKAARRPAETEAEKARRTEQLVQAGVAANKYPPL
jgi:hypothetical protein